MIGKTDGKDAEAGTIRGDFSMSTRFTIVHASDSPEAAAWETKIFFGDNPEFAAYPFEYLQAPFCGWLVLRNDYKPLYQNQTRPQRI